MPNNVTNKLKILGSKKDVKALLDFIQMEELGKGTIDFNKITPMPLWVYGSQDERGITLEDEQQWGKDYTKLAWSNNNWGTKWNAYQQPDQRATEDTIYFQTAWNDVAELIFKLGWIFPNVTLEYSFANEDKGSSKCGSYRFKNSEILETIKYKKQSKEAYEIAFNLIDNGNVPEEYVFDTVLNTYVNTED